MVSVSPILNPIPPMPDGCVVEAYVLWWLRRNRKWSNTEISNLTRAYTGFVACVCASALCHVRVSLQAISIGIGGIGKFWYRSKPSRAVWCVQSALSSLEDMKQAVNSGQTVTDRTHRERSCPSQKKQFLLDRHVSFRWTSLQQA